MTPGIRAYRQAQKALATVSTDPSEAEKRKMLRERLHDIVLRLTPSELRMMSDAPSPRSRCCGG